MPHVVQVYQFLFWYAGSSLRKEDVMIRAGVAQQHTRAAQTRTAVHEKKGVKAKRLPDNAYMAPHLVRSFSRFPFPLPLHRSFVFSGRCPVKFVHPPAFSPVHQSKAGHFRLRPFPQGSEQPVYFLLRARGWARWRRDFIGPVGMQGSPVSSGIAPLEGGRRKEGGRRG